MTRILTVFLLLAASAFAAAPTWTTNTIGPNGTGSYSSIAAWEDAVDGNLTEAGNNTVQVGEIFGNWTGTNDTTIVDFNGSTCDATHFLMVYTTPEARHKGSWSTSYYNLSVADSAMDISDSYVVIDGLQVEEVNSGSRTAIYSTTGGTYPTVKNCIMRCDSSGTTSVGWGHGAVGGYVYNCFIINRATAGTGFYDNSSAGNGSTNINITMTNAAAAGAAVGIYLSHAAQTISNAFINCIFAGFASNNCNAGRVHPNSSYNATTASSMYLLGDSGNTGDRLSQTFTFTNTANCHLAATDGGARTYGTSSYSGIFNTDIDGETRPATWDIGCDQYISAAPVTFAAPRGISLRGFRR